MVAKPKSDELAEVFRACRSYFLTALLFSLAINLLYLASPLYMLQVYDRVVSSASQHHARDADHRSAGGIAALAGLDAVRARRAHASQHPP